MARACTTALLLLSAASALLSAATALRQPQTVTLRDVHSKRDVTLVGAMHYNPCSIALATQCVEEQEGLGGDPSLAQTPRKRRVPHWPAHTSFHLDAGNWISKRVKVGMEEGELSVSAGNNAACHH